MYVQRTPIIGLYTNCELKETRDSQHPHLLPLSSDGWSGVELENLPEQFKIFAVHFEILKLTLLLHQ